MSKRIDISDPSTLSDEDRAYLRQRGRVNVLDHLDYMARVDAAAAQVNPEGEGESDVVEVDEPYEKWKVDDLRDECAARDLPVDGNKSDLVERLNAHDRDSA